jgi:hypothetical protein
MKFSRPLVIAALLSVSQSAFGFFVDGDGHYALRGETRTNPEFSKETGTYQAIEQSFRLKGEARFNDISSMFLEFRLFDNPREAYLGDTAEPENCRNSTGTDENCPTRSQNSGEPSYKPYTPKITQAYVRYGFDYCIIEAGRRGRNWGLGIFMDAGEDPFETSSSVYDGFTCDVNIQKTQTLGFSVGYDKLSETGVGIDPPANDNRRYGANDIGDDMDQFFFTIKYDDTKANAGSAFTKQIGVYFAQVNSTSLKNGGSNTDIKFLDLYTAFFVGDLVIRNEILFRMGKSADPNWIALGGEARNGGEPATNKLESIALAGSLAWIIDKSGAPVGPAEYNQGDATQHLMFFDYAYAPGDEHGYYGTNESGPLEGGLQNDGFRRDSKVSAMAFHRNYKPALLLFNARPEADNLTQDGVFNPSRMVNASMMSTGYRYESMENGNFEFKLITATLLEGMPGNLKKQYEDVKRADAANGTKNDDGKRPAGFHGKHLGYELDMSYSKRVGKEATLGIAAGFALAGDAWKVDENSEPLSSAVVQTYAAFRF